MVEDGYCVRPVPHQDGRKSYWIFSADGEIHRDALNLLKRYGPSTQQTYAYSLLDHLHWLDVHGKEPRDVTFDDLRRPMKCSCPAGIGSRASTPKRRRPRYSPAEPSAATRGELIRAATVLIWSSIGILLWRYEYSSKAQYPVAIPFPSSCRVSLQRRRGWSRGESPPRLALSVALRGQEGAAQGAGIHQTSAVTRQ